MKIKKIQMLVGLFGILVFFVATGELMDAQIKVQKKPTTPPGQDKPPEDTWSARIPIDSYNLVGMDNGEYIYADDNPAVAVIVSKSDRSGVTKTFIKLFVYQNDGSVWARMPNVVFEEGWITDTGDPCGFPFPYNNLELPNCISEFMGSAHPHPGYEHIMIQFDIYDDIEDEQFFPLGDPITYTGPARVAFYIWNNFECDNPDRIEPWYHTVSGQITYPSDGFIITRMNENTWRIEVSQIDFPISESYCYEEPGEPIGNSGRYKVIHESFTPFAGVASLSYALEIIKSTQ
jgi:hypothetical protein